MDECVQIASNKLYSYYYTTVTHLWRVPQQVSYIFILLIEIDYFSCFHVGNMNAKTRAPTEQISS
jgi:hypothetical protein